MSEQPTHEELQSALKHRPGKYGAIALFNGKRRFNADQLKEAIAQILNCFSLEKNKPGNLHILVAINPRLIGHLNELDTLPKYSNTYSMPSTQNDLLIQVSAATRTDCLFALRVVHAILGRKFRCKNEIFGGSLRYDQEPFGFYHGSAAEKEHINEIARINEGELAGGSWLLYQLYKQNLKPFAEMSLSAQEDVMGAESVASNEVETSEYPDTAHTRVVKSPEPLPVMSRRGFAYRRDGVEGTAFVAASASTRHFSSTLDRMLAKDAMLEFTEATQGGIYFVPPNGDWLSPNAGTPELPNDAKYLPLHMQAGLDGPAVSLEDYMVAAAFIEYLNTLRSYGMLTGPIGEQEFDPRVLKLLQAINDVMAGGELTTDPEVSTPDPEKKAKLDELFRLSLAVPNRVNTIAKKYMTVG